MSAEGARLIPNLSGKRIEYKLYDLRVIVCICLHIYIFGVAKIGNSFIFHLRIFNGFSIIF